MTNSFQNLNVFTTLSVSNNLLMINVVLVVD